MAAIDSRYEPRKKTPGELNPSEKYMVYIYILKMVRKEYLFLLSVRVVALIKVNLINIGSSLANELIKGILLD